MIRPKYILLALATFISSILHAQRNSVYQEYIDTYSDMAVEQMRQHKIPASITMAQALLESGAGRSYLATNANNHFGIKVSGGWTGPYVRRDDDRKNEKFRKYRNVKESYEDHSLFLKQPRYSRLFSLRQDDYKAWARGLKACGYATNPQYADKLIEIIELYQLHQYDTNTPYRSTSKKSSGSNIDIAEAGSWIERIFKSGKTNKTKKKTKKEDLLGKVVKNHRIYMYNDNLYIIAQQGETFRSIALDVNISYRSLAKYNERDKNTVLANGDIVYLKKKATKAEKKYKGFLHTVMAGQSMYDISQMYGIRLSSLYKMNNLPNDYMPRVGDRLRVY